MKLEFKLWMEDWGDCFPNANTETSFKRSIRSQRQEDGPKKEKSNLIKPEILFGIKKKRHKYS